MTDAESREKADRCWGVLLPTTRRCTRDPLRLRSGQALTPPEVRLRWMTPVGMQWSAFTLCHYLRARCWAEIMSDAQFFTGWQTITVKEVACGRTLFAFELNLKQFDRSMVAAAD